MIYDSNPPAFCPHNYNDYDENPQTITSRVWVCGAAKDRAGIVGTSSGGPVEFLVDSGKPTTTIDPDGAYSSRTSVDFTLSCSDTGGSGCSQIYYAIINPEWQSCPAAIGDYTAGNAGTVTVPSVGPPGPDGEGHARTVCFFSTDVAGNRESTKYSYFQLGVPVVATDDDAGNAPKTPGTCTESEEYCECIEWFRERCLEWYCYPPVTADFIDYCSGGITREYFPDIDLQFCDLEMHTCTDFNECNPAASCPGDTCVYHEYGCDGWDGGGGTLLCGNGVCDSGETTANCKPDCCPEDCFMGIPPPMTPEKCDNYDVCKCIWWSLGTGFFGEPPPATCADCTSVCATNDNGADCWAEEDNLGNNICKWENGECKCDWPGYERDTPGPGFCKISNIYDPDDSQTYCDDCLGSGYWDVGGEAWAENDKCCGDDAEEYYNYLNGRQTGDYYDVAWSDDTGIEACCDNAN
ncbi:MAG: hypothetical protein KAU24_04580, partial [Candidatus Aenigmarchaeota archaeon]|nr:hypothetical protein [Candidatus Aenigmarchaeota archaeon]